MEWSEIPEKVWTCLRGAPASAGVGRSAEAGRNLLENATEKIAKTWHISSRRLSKTNTNNPQFQNFAELSDRSSATSSGTFRDRTLGSPAPSFVASRKSAVKLKAGKAR
jgi:hypothetical protein